MKPELHDPTVKQYGAGRMEFRRYLKDKGMTLDDEAFKKMLKLWQSIKINELEK